jgi:hypothetical protein
MPAENRINIGNLGFEDIRNSIINFLKTENVGAASYLNDYTYDGSAMATLIDLLSYNTLYYAFYTNMIANEMFLDSAQKEESLISLTKPLGYAVPGYNSAVATVSVTKGGAGNIIKRLEHKFKGTGSDESFTFVAYQDYTLDGQGKHPSVKLYEAKSVILRLNFPVDIDSQSISLNAYPNIDISSLIVEVSEDRGSTWDEYILSSNISFNVGEDQKLYWLERDSTGFKIIFGGLEEELKNISVGRRIETNDMVQLSFVLSSGPDGNEMFSFITDGMVSGSIGNPLSENNEITTLSSSSGGSDGPNLDSVRFYAPRWFASQDRAVTKDDCVGLLQEKSYDNFSLWGGDEATPPQYGKVLMSFDDDNECENASSFLDNKLPVTIFSECVPSELFSLLVNVNGVFNPNETPRSQDELNSIVESTINSLYRTEEFNTVFDKTQITEELKKKDKALTISDSGISLKIRNTQSTSTDKRKIKFLTKLNRGSVAGGTISSSQITSSTLSDEPFWLQDDPNTNNIIAFNIINGVRNIISETAGTIDYNTGIVELDAGVSVSSFTITAILPQEELIFTAKENIKINVASSANIAPRG